MTMRATIITADVIKDGARLLVGNSGLTYEMFLSAPLGRNYNFFKKSATTGRKVYIEFKDINSRLEIKAIDFIKEFAA